MVARITSTQAMGAQIVATPSGERLAVLPETDYLALVEAAEDSEDIAAVRRFRSALAAGEEELVPAAIVERILAGESPIRVWREHRGLTARTLAERAGVAKAYLSQLETGKRDGTIETMRRIAAVLGTTIDDLV